MSSLKVTIESTKANRLICSKVYTHTHPVIKRDVSMKNQFLSYVCLYESAQLELKLLFCLLLWIHVIINPTLLSVSLLITYFIHRCHVANKTCPKNHSWSNRLCRCEPVPDTLLSKPHSGKC